MQATIHFLLTEQAQRAAMAATGQPVTRKQTRTVEVAHEDIPLYTVDEAGTLTLDLTTCTQHGDALRAIHAEYKGSAIYWLRDVGADPVALIKAGYAKIEEAKRLSDEKNAAASAENLEKQTVAIDRFMSDVLLRSTPQYSATNNYTWIAGTRVDGEHPRWRELTDEIQRRNLADEATAQAKKDAFIAAFLADPSLRSRCDTGNQIPGYDVPSSHPRYAEVVAESKRRAAVDKEAEVEYIAEWVGENADADTREQHVAGLLCRKDAVQMIADLRFAGLLKFEPTICGDSDCKCGRTDIDCIPTSKFTLWKKIKATLPEDATWEFESVQECMGDMEISDKRYAVLVKAKAGPFSLERLVRL